MLLSVNKPNHTGHRVRVALDTDELMTLFGRGHTIKGDRVNVTRNGKNTLVIQADTNGTHAMTVARSRERPAYINASAAGVGIKQDIIAPLFIEKVKAGHGVLTATIPTRITGRKEVVRKGPKTAKTAKKASKTAKVGKAVIRRAKATLSTPDALDRASDAVSALNKALTGSGWSATISLQRKL